MSVTKPTHSANQHQATQAIGVFDSGVGGLSIHTCITRLLPQENIIYVADNAFAPYGCKNENDIDRRVAQICQWLIDQNVKAIVVACNTATASSIDKLRQSYSIPIIGVEPAIKPAVTLTKSGKIGLLVTKATASNQRFSQLIERCRQDATVIIQPCPGLVDFIESGQQNSTQCQQLLTAYLTPLVTAGVDTLVLGCTHYPFLSEVITQIVGDKMQLIETAKPVTEQLIRQLAQHQLLNQSVTKPTHMYYASQTNQALAHLISQLLNKKITKVIPLNV